LEFVRGNVSGGADDMAGVALQFAASEWLRTRRHAAWSTCVLDEPTAQMDPAHRKAFARMVLGETAFEQVLVVSHHQATLDALPGKILVVAGEGGSRVSVVA
jgi:DNA repair exonuclease SbcCD ATPase subunit